MCLHKLLNLGRFTGVMMVVSVSAVAQEHPVYLLNLDDALRLAEKNNVKIIRSGIESEIGEEMVKETKEQRLPEIDFNSSYARVSNITEFTRGNFGNSKITPIIPQMYGSGLTGSVPLYKGGAINAAVRKSEIENKMTQLNYQKTIKDVHLEVASLYLGVYKLMETKKLIAENIEEEKKRLKEVQSLYRNGVVTKNEILRAELQIAEREQALLANKKETDIMLHEIRLMLQLPEEVHVEVDTTRLLSRLMYKERDYHGIAATGNEELLLSRQGEQLQHLNVRIARSGYYPQIRLFGSYAYKYPNYMFFPPDPYPYTFGQVGIDAVFSISGLYKNRTKVATAKKREEAARSEVQVKENEIEEKVFRNYTQYNELLDRFSVADKAEELAAENYRLVRLQYLNQLSLVTEMIDADNALLEARYNKVALRIDAAMKYYELLHASGISLTLNNNN